MAERREIQILYNQYRASLVAYLQNKMTGVREKQPVDENLLQRVERLANIQPESAEDFRRQVGVYISTLELSRPVGTIILSPKIRAAFDAIIAEGPVAGTILPEDIETEEKSLRDSVKQLSEQDLLKGIISALDDPDVDEYDKIQTALFLASRGEKGTLYMDLNF